MKKYLLILFFSAFCQQSFSQIPGVTNFGSLSAGNQPLSLLDSSFLAVQSYINGAKTCAGVFTNTQMNNCGSTSVNSLSFLTEYQAVQGAEYTTDALSFGVAVPNTSVVHQANGVSGYANNLSTSTNAVGGYFQSQCLANSTSCWGINAVANAGPGLTTGVSLIGMEMDVGSASALSSLAGAYGYTATIAGTSGGNGATGTGFFAASNTGQTSNVFNRQWNYGFQTQDGGIANSAFLAGALCTSGTCNGQPISFRSMNSSVVKNATINSDSSGNVIVSLGTNNLVSTGGVVASKPIVNNGAGGDGEIQAGYLLLAGQAINGQGGQVRLINDAGATNWTVGIPGNTGSKDFFVYDALSATQILGITHSTGLFTAYSGATLDGTVTLSNITTGTNTDFLCLAAGGVVTLQSTACTISSKRFKDDLGDPHLNASRTLDCLRLAYFKKKDGASNPDINEKNPQYGLYAEDVEKCDKTLSIYEPDGVTVKSYRQESVIALLIAGWQEQDSQIKMLWGCIVVLSSLVLIVGIKAFSRK